MSEIIEEKRRTVAVLQAEYENLRRDCDELLQFRISGVSLREIREEYDALENKRRMVTLQNLDLPDAEADRLDALVDIPEVLLFNSMHDKEKEALAQYEKILKELKEFEAVLAYYAPQSPPKVQDGAVLGEFAGPTLTDPNIGAQPANNVNQAFIDSLLSKPLSVVTLRRKPNELQCI